MKKLTHLFALLTISMALVACGEEEANEPKKEEPLEVAEENATKNTKEPTDEKTTDDEEPKEATESTGNATLDFMNENSTDYDELLAEAIQSNPYSEALIKEKTKEAIAFLEKVYGKDATFTKEEAIATYFAENTKIPSSSMDSLVAYFISMNVPGETAEFTYQVDKAEQVSVDAIEIQFKADITFFKVDTNEKIDAITRYHTVRIAPSKEDKEKFIIYRLDIRE